ncbi:MAG: hypothetical protein ACI30R_10315 [Sodaliphilus sp.]
MMKDFVIFCAMMVVGLCSCGGGTAKCGDVPAADSLGLNDSVVRKYVACPESVASSLIAVGDTVYAHTGAYTLDDLGLRNERYNRWLSDTYTDTIPVAVSLFDSYDQITCSELASEADVSFIWHEVAKAQIIRFLQKKGHEDAAGIDKVLEVAEQMVDYYSAGNEGEMTIAAARKVVIADYRLIDAYKQLMDRYADVEVKRLAREDYEFVMDMCRKYSEMRHQKDHYSDLEHELRCAFYEVLRTKAAAIHKLLADNATLQAVIQNLSEHTCVVGKQSVNLSIDVISTHYAI